MKNNLIALLFLFICSPCLSQNDSISSIHDDALKVFLDCYFCDLDYIRNEIAYVNYVRDTRAAQVHILGTVQTTGSGGTEYTFNFIGQKEFIGKNDTLSLNLKADATFDEKRERRSQFLKIGLMPYVAKTPMIDQLEVNYKAATEQEEVTDKWDYWVFRISGNGYFNGEELYKYKSLNSSISANRITENWKFENWANIGFNESKFVIDRVTTYTNYQDFVNMNNSAIHGINNHWSAGVISNLRSSTYSNIDLSYNIKPAVEYNVFDYKDFNTKQIRFQYRIGFNSFSYRDTTIYGEIQENLFNHSLSVAAEFRQKWGTLYISADASQYLHDTSLRNLSIYSSLSWRIAKGLNFNISGNIGFIQDQISLPRDGASDLEILTQQRQLATQYSYWGSVGLSYTFGSIYNNIVNPRFWN